MTKTIKLRRALFFEGILHAAGSPCPKMDNPPSTAKCYEDDKYLGTVGELKAKAALAADAPKAKTK